jgi:predicted alpha/beta-hydrolase family hydrolase
MRELTMTDPVISPTPLPGGANWYAANGATGVPSATLILAHGAGAGQFHPFMVGYARALAAGGLDVVTFNFGYMEQKRRVPDKAPVLEARYREVIDIVLREVPSAKRALVIGGKSMGGRLATHVAAADHGLPSFASVRGLVLLGYPLHPPGQPQKLRDAHLPAIQHTVLFVQGSRDTFGTPGELQPVLARMQPPPTLHVVEGGDHSFKVSGRKDVDAAVQGVILDWIGQSAR